MSDVVTFDDVMPQAKPSVVTFDDVLPKAAKPGVVTFDDVLPQTQTASTAADQSQSQPSISIGDRFKMAGNALNDAVISAVRGSIGTGGDIGQLLVKSATDAAMRHFGVKPMDQDYNDWQRKKLDDWQRDYFTNTTDATPDTAQKIINFAAAAPPFILAGEAAPALVAGQMADSFRKRAEANGETDPQKLHNAQLAGWGLGMATGIGFTRMAGGESGGIIEPLLEKLGVSGLTKTSAGKALVSGIGAAPEMAAIGAVTQVAEDAHAHAMGYKDVPENYGTSEYWKDVAKNAAVQGAGAALVGAVTGYAHAKSEAQAAILDAASSPLTAEVIRTQSAQESSFTPGLNKHIADTLNSDVGEGAGDAFAGIKKPGTQSPIEQNPAVTPATTTGEQNANTINSADLAAKARGIAAKTPEQPSADATAASPANSNPADGQPRPASRGTGAAVPAGDVATLASVPPAAAPVPTLEQTLQLKHSLEQELKRRSMIYQHEEKRDAARLLGLQPDALLHLDYESWRALGKKIVAFQDKASAEFTGPGDTLNGKIWADYATAHPDEISAIRDSITPAAEPARDTAKPEQMTPEEAAGNSTPLSESDTATAGESTQSIVNRTETKEERNAAFSARAEATSRLSASLRPGDKLTTPDGETMVVDQVLGKHAVIFKGRDDISDPRVFLSAGDAIDSKSGLRIHEPAATITRAKEGLHPDLQAARVGGHEKAIKDATRTQQPVSAAAAEAYGLQGYLAKKGYVKRGELYVHEAKPAAQAPAPAAPTPVEPVIKPVPTGATGKEAWQKTKSEFVKTRPDNSVGNEVSQSTAEIGAKKKGDGYYAVKVKDAWRNSAGKIAEPERWQIKRKLSDAEKEKDHREWVEAAIKAGKPVPPEVLADYPDLRPTPTAEQVAHTAAAIKIDAPKSDGPGAAAKAEFPEQGKVGAYNAKVDEQRAQRGLEPLMSRAREANPDTWDKAVARIESDPEHPAQLVEDIHAGKKSVSRDEQAELLWRMTDLRNKLEMESARAADPNATPEEQATAQDNSEIIERQLHRTEQADRTAGSAQGAALQFRQVLANEDYTFGGLMRKAREKNKGPLSEEQRATIKQQADQIAELQKRVDEAKGAKEEAQAQVELTRVHEATIADLQKELQSRPKFGKDVIDIARGVVSRWRAEADAVSNDIFDLLKSDVGAVGDVGGSGKMKLSDAQKIKANIVTKLALEIRATIGELGLKGAELNAKLIDKFGDKVTPYISAAMQKARQMIEAEKVSVKAKEAVKRGVKTDKTPADIKARVKADAVAGDELSHNAVAELWKAHVRDRLSRGEDVSGDNGAKAVLKAVHADIKEFYPDATERDVQRAYSDYGKAKFPSKDADKVALAEHRRILQLQESIDRIKDGQDALKTGLQRDKATQSIREKQAELNELLKKRIGPPSPEKLASRDEARQTALRNRIADIDKELRTGETRPKSEPTPPSDKTKALMAERDAMQAKLDKVRAEKPEVQAAKAQKALESQQKSTQKQIDDIKAKLAGDSPEKSGTSLERPAHPALEPLLQQRDNLREQLAESRAMQARSEALDRQKESIQKEIDEKKSKLASGDLSTDATGAKMNRPMAIKELEQLRQSLDEVNKQLSDARKSEAQEAGLQKRIDDLNEMVNAKTAKLAAGDLSSDATGRRMNRPLPNAELEQAQQRMDGINKQLADARKQAREAARATPEERYNAMRQKAIAKQLAEIKDRIARNDYSKPPKRVPPEKNAATVRAEVDLAKAKRAADEGRMKIEQAQRTYFRKSMDWIAGFTRANVLGHISVLEHLAGAAVENIVTRPVGSATAQLFRLNRTLNEIRKKAVYEGGWGGEMKGAAATLKSLNAAWHKIKTGKSDLDWMHDTGKVYPKGVMEWVGGVHAAIKEPVRQGIYARAMELGMKAAEERGLSPSTDEVLYKAISKDAYDVANMDIFIGDNILTKALHHSVVGYLRNEKTNPGLSKLTANVLDILFPVVNAPTNIAIRKLRLVVGLPESATRLAIVAKRGDLANNAAKLTPRDAELITRAFKYGLVGAAAGIYAWTHANQFGGIQTMGQQAPRDKTTGLAPGDIALPGGGHISHHLAHGPNGGHMNMIADAKRLYDKRVAAGGDQWTAKGEVAFFMMFSAFKDLPMMSTVGRLTSPFKSAGQKAGEMMKNMFIFGAAQDAAKSMDKDSDGTPIKRRGDTFVDQIKSGIPGLRQQVPIYEKPQPPTTAAGMRRQMLRDAGVPSRSSR